MRSAGTAVVLLLMATTSISAQQIRGRVVDEQSRSALVEATVTLRAVGDSTVIDRAGTTADGFFTVRAPGPGGYSVVVERIGYAAVERTVELGAQRELVVPAFVLQDQAIRMEGITAEARTRIEPELAAGFRRSSHMVSGERLAKLEQMGASMDAAVRRLSAGVRVRDLTIPGMTRALSCVEATRRLPPFRGGGVGGSTCDMVAIVLDGMTVPDPLGFFQHIDLRDYESIEFVPAAGAGMYGMDAGTRGALVLWSRGRGPNKSSARGGGGQEL